MTTTESSADQSHILVASPQAAWVDPIRTYLADSGYRVEIITDVANLIPDDIATDVDALLAAATSEAAALFAQLAAREATPLLIFISADETLVLSDPALYAQCDTVLPPNAAYLQQQLALLLRLHTENRQLRAKAQAEQKGADKRRKIEREMELLKNAIVRNVSHELRTPLLQVKSAVSLIDEDYENKKLINFAKNATARLETLVKNITMLGSSLDMNIGPIIFRDAVEFARRNLGRIWQRGGEEADRVEFVIEPNLPPVMADKQGLSTVLQQLMDNALKFSDDPIQVIARRDPDGKHVYIAVKDSGIGIEKSQIQKIFDSFFQIDSSSTRRYGGMGVGLALVKLILDNHHTTIHVDSELGEGSTFWFLLEIVHVESLDDEASS